jgi:cytochrome c553
MKYRPVVLACALLVVSGWVQAQALAPAPAMDPLQMRSMAAACAGCHGTHGLAQSGHASLAGLPRAELLQKMLDFKTGAKPATLMHQISRGYSDEQLGAMAAYFSVQKK